MKAAGSCIQLYTRLQPPQPARPPRRRHGRRLLGLDLPLPQDSGGWKKKADEKSVPQHIYWMRSWFVVHMYVYIYKVTRYRTFQNLCLGAGSAGHGSVSRIIIYQLINENSRTRGGERGSRKCVSWGHVLRHWIIERILVINNMLFCISPLHIEVNKSSLVIAIT